MSLRATTPGVIGIECFQKSQLLSQSHSLGVDALRLTVPEINKAVKTAVNVNCILVRVVGGVELGGAENFRKACSAPGLSSSSCIGNRQVDVAGI